MCTLNLVFSPLSEWMPVAQKPPNSTFLTYQYQALFCMPSFCQLGAILPESSGFHNNTPSEWLLRGARHSRISTPLLDLHCPRTHRSHSHKPYRPMHKPTLTTWCSTNLESTFTGEWGPETFQTTQVRSSFLVFIWKYWRVLLIYFQ